MADEYVTRCTLTCNGQSISDFSSFTENERVLRKQINLMNKTGYANMTPRHGFSLDYVVPANAPEFDFAAVENGTFVAEFEGGARINYSGVSVLRIGESKSDGENEKVKTIDFVASTRTEE